MKHSIIIKIGENLVYQCSPYQKPVAEATSSPVEFNRALPEWEHSSKNYIIKPDDVNGFVKYIDAERMFAGVPVPYDFVEVYLDNLKSYARFSESPNRALDVSASKPLNQITTSHYNPKDSNKAFESFEDAVAEFTLSVDEDGGVVLLFKDHKGASELEKKLFKAFVKKAIVKGMDLIPLNYDSEANKDVVKFELKIAK